MDIQATLQHLVDSKAIRELRFTYARGLDQRNFELAASPYAEEAHFKSPDSEYHGRKAIRDAVSGITKYKKTMHTILNHLSEVKGDEATSETYCVAYHFYDVNGVQQQYVMGIRYEDTLRRRNGRWEIMHCKANFDWFTGQSLLFAARNAGAKPA